LNKLSPPLKDTQIAEKNQAKDTTEKPTLYKKNKIKILVLPSLLSQSINHFIISFASSNFKNMKVFSIRKAFPIK